MNNKISVIIPTFNRRHLIGYTINNLLSQTKLPDEIIVVDDHSVDGTVEWLRKTYNNKLIITTSLGQGPGAARNTGLRIASGNYIQFFDSDDLITKNKLEVQFNLLKNKTDTFVYGPYAIASAFPDSWKLLNGILQYHSLPDNNLRKWIYRGWCSITQACLFPRELIEKVGSWREDIYTHEDREYWYRIAKQINSSPIHEKESCTIYRQHNDQLTLSSERQIQRASDSVIVDNILLKDNETISPSSKLYLLARIASTKQNLNRLTNKNTDQKTLLLSFIHRVINKINRLITGSNWEPMHGIITDNEVFLKYKKNISIEPIQLNNYEQK